MHKLPFDAYEEKFLELVRKNQIVVLAAETGAGKSTKAPLALLKSGIASGKIIGVTEPRRPAATNLSRYVEVLDGSRGRVAYQIGQDNKARRSTKLKYMTEGILLAEMQGDPLLKRYGVLVLDEVHERGVNQDLLMALVKVVAAHRSDLKIVVMSATIDTHKFSQYFGNAPILEVPGRVFPVEVRYASESPSDYMKAAARKVEEILNASEPGDILVFMPDQESIMRAVGMIEDKSNPDKVSVLPLFGAQAPEDQAKVFDRNGKRRVIVATNIAETSLTIEGVRHIVDTGLIKAMCYVDASMSALQVTEHSRAGCDQRKGRAGRTQDGICHRLYSKWEYDQRTGFTEPEINRMALDQVLLRLLCMGLEFDDVVSLDLLDKPSQKKWEDAHARLNTLGALKENGSVNSDGKRMNKLQVEPMIGRMILEGEKHGCLSEVVTVAAALSATRPVFTRPKGKEDMADARHQAFYVAGSDPLTSMNVWQRWVARDRDRRWCRDNFVSSKALSQIDRMRKQFIRALERDRVEIASSLDQLKLKKAVASGLIVNLAKKAGRFSYVWNGRETFIFPGSVLFRLNPEMLVCTRVVSTKKPYMRGCHMIEEKWLAEILPSHMVERTLKITGAYDTHPNTLVAEVSWQGVNLGSSIVMHIREDEISLLANALVERVVGYSEPIHSSDVHNKSVASEFNTIVGWNMARKEAMRAQMVVQFTARLKGADTWPKVLEVDLKLDLSDFVTEEELEQNAERLERDRVLRQQREIREAEQQRVREQRKATAREAVDRITQKAKDLGIENYGSIPRLRDYAERNSIFDWSVTEYRDAVRKVEREVLPKVRATEEIYARVLELMPICPLCGGDWDKEHGQVFICKAEHNAKRLIAENGMSVLREFGQFVTNRDEMVASIALAFEQVSLVFEVKPRQAFQGKSFKTIEHKRTAHVLSDELLENRDDLAEWLRELASAKRSLRDELRSIEQLQQEIGNGQVLRLTFKTRSSDSRAIASHKGTTYVAEWSDLYPVDGETWYCKVMPENTMSNDRSVTAIRKAGEFSAIEDVDRLRGEIVELFGDEVSPLVN